eukprot:gene30415-34488_t
MLWLDGTFILSNSTLNIASTASFTVQGSDSTKVLNMVSDESREKFDIYPSFVLNTQVNLANILPTSRGIYDLVIDRAVEIRSSSVVPALQFWPLAVVKDSLAAAFYASVKNITYGYKHSMYNVQLTNMNEDECAAQCTGTFVL